MWLLLLAVVASAHGFSDNPFFYEHWFVGAGRCMMTWRGAAL
jgi:hypothetical protein